LEAGRPMSARWFCCRKCSHLTEGASARVLCLDCRRKADRRATDASRAGDQAALARKTPGAGARLRPSAR
jgi:hypothetical protein